MKIKKIMFAAFIGLKTLMGTSPHVVTFFVDTFPAQTENNLKKNTSLKPEDGMFFSYFGYQTALDNNRQITFPLKTVDPHFYFLVSNDVTPVFMLDNTISHWELKDGGRYMLFSVRRKYDEKAKTHFWSTEQTEFEDNLEIPLNTITAHVDPTSIHVRTGIMKTSDSAQLLLPEIFIKSTTTLAKDALRFLEYRELFAPINRTFKISDQTRESKV
jgi:hypothetical protein